MTDTSSIGPGWPPAETSCGRIKGIDTRGVVRKRSQLEALTASLEALAQELGTPESGACDRLSLRAVCDEDLVARSLADLEPWVEAALPLDDGSERTLIYLGRNGSSRPCDRADLERALDNVETAERRGPQGARTMRERVLSAGYGLRILSRTERLRDDAVLSGVAELYRRFGWDRDETRQILGHPQSLIAVATVGSGRHGSGETDAGET
ncbi:MAG: hypothetical protein AAFY88_30545, partial [Acidobacteriota bacterium]